MKKNSQFIRIKCQNLSIPPQKLSRKNHYMNNEHKMILRFERFIWVLKAYFFIYIRKKFTMNQRKMQFFVKIKIFKKKKSRFVA